ncbi:WXG100 family type VII secretion target [Micromonospora sp. NPDC049282]|uniref:WXG100 family type VII secretion target n=1 Tax=Micromonospora sp. NPDC049282 TaxID=3364269 RepID=UPI00372218D2
MTTNPLVAPAVDTPADPWAGVWIAEDIELINRGITDGSWIDGTLGVVGAGLDALALISDPVGVLLQYGVAWIIEHVRPLSEALDWLAGDPAQIAANAQTWRNVAGSLRDSVAELARAVAADVADWGGTAGPAYRAWATRQQNAIDGLARAADTMALITEGAGFLIAAVRLLVRDAIATLVSRLVVYAVEELASLGFATPLVVEQVTTLVASWAAKIARWLRALLDSIRHLMPVIRRLGELITELKRILKSLRGKPPELLREGDGIARNGRKILMNMDNVRAVAAKYGIDIDGVNLTIDKVRVGGGPGKEFYGVTTADGRIILCRDAFRSEEQLARTLAHERFHLDEVRSGMPVPRSRKALDEWEKRAYAYENQWWEQHKHLFGG